MVYNMIFTVNTILKKDMTAQLHPFIRRAQQRSVKEAQDDDFVFLFLLQKIIIYEISVY